MLAELLDVFYQVPGGVVLERGVRRGFARATLVKENASVVGGVEVASSCASQIVRELETRRPDGASPVAVIYASSWSSVKVHDRDATWLAALLIVQRVDGRDFQMP